MLIPFRRKYFLYKSLPLKRKALQIFYLSSLFTFVLLSGCWSGNVQPTNGNHGELDSFDNLANLDIEELMDIEFVTIFKKRGRLFEIPAAVYSVNQKDIQGIGANNLPDVLRTVPGMQVSQHDANSWAITSRGFSGLSRGINGQFANKLLVLNDGRSVYTPLFSGVSWETQDLLLDDVARMEVIRGPGAALWGANAVNGIINVVSKNADDTQGGLVTFGGGTEQRTFGHFRYGGRLSNRSFYRAYAKFSKTDNLSDLSGSEAADDWHIFRGGFKSDSYFSNADVLTLQGEIYDGRVGQTYNTDVATLLEGFSIEDATFRANVSGGHLLGKWRHQFSNYSDFALQFYFDRVRQKDPIVHGRIDTYDLDFQHRFWLGSRQEIIWGGGFRFISDSFDSTNVFSLNPHSRNLKLYSAFVQDEISIIRNRLRLILGSKFEHNDFTGLELQPNARLLFTLNKRHTFWGAVSRAVRTPSRAEVDARIILNVREVENFRTLEILFGDSDFKSEELTAFEIGYRVQPETEFTLDIAAFNNIYAHLRADQDSITYLAPNLTPLTFINPLTVTNKMKGRNYGVEVAANLQASKHWHLIGTYSYLKMDLELQAGLGDAFSQSVERQSPVHQFFLRSSFELSRQLEFDLNMRHVSSLPAQGVGSYTTADAALHWQVFRNLKFMLVGRNLLQNHHFENSRLLIEDVVSTVTKASRIQREFYVKFAWQF